MVVDKTDIETIADIKINIHQIDQVEKFYYLGSQITNDNRSIEDVKKKITHVKLAFQRKRNILVNQNLSITMRKLVLKDICMKHLDLWMRNMDPGETEK